MTKQPDTMLKLIDKIRHLHSRGLFGIQGDYSITDDEYGKLITVLLSAAVPSPDGARREAFYTILTKYIPQQSIDQAWQELREAGVVP